MNEPSIGLENPNVSAKNSRGKKIFIGLFVLVVLIVVAVVTYIATMATPKKVFVSSLDKVFESMNETSDINTVVGDMTLDINVDTEEDNEIYDILNSLDVKLDYAVDYENKKMNFGLDSSYEEKELLTLHAYAKDENAYVYLDEVFNKYIQVPLEGYSEIFDTEKMMTNYKTIISEIEKALDSSLKDEYFTSEKTTLTIDGKETDVTKNILNLNNENYKILSKDIATSLNNDTFIKSVAELTETEEADIKESLENAINGDIEEIEDLTISIYTTGMTKKVVAFEVKDASDTLLVTAEKNDTYNFELSGEDKFNGTVKVSEKDGKNVLSVTVNVEDTTENIKVTVSLEMTYKYNETIEDVDTSNYVAMDSLTENDQTTIMMNLMTNEGIAELMELFSGLYSTDTDYSDDYTYDYSDDSDYDYDYDYYDTSDVTIYE